MYLSLTDYSRHWILWNHGVLRLDRFVLFCPVVSLSHLSTDVLFSIDQLGLLACPLRQALGGEVVHGFVACMHDKEPFRPRDAQIVGVA